VAGLGNAENRGRQTALTQEDQDACFTAAAAIEQATLLEELQGLGVAFVSLGEGTYN
jgi:hypothetical protein